MLIAHYKKGRSMEAACLLFSSFNSKELVIQLPRTMRD